MIDVRFRDPWASAVAIEADAARCRIVDQIEPAASRTLPLSDCVGLVLADAGVAAEASPWFDTAAMDGHAMHRLTGRGAAWRVVGRASAGNPFSGEIRPGEAIRIMTGACVPPGASVVTPLESATEIDGEARRAFNATAMSDLPRRPDGRLHVVPHHRV